MGLLGSVYFVAKMAASIGLVEMKHSSKCN